MFYIIVTATPDINNIDDVESYILFLQPLDPQIGTQA
jgi:hypothetical protein